MSETKNEFDGARQAIKEALSEEESPVELEKKEETSEEEESKEEESKEEESKEEESKESKEEEKEEESKEEEEEEEEKKKDDESKKVLRLKEKVSILQESLSKVKGQRDEAFEVISSYLEINLPKLSDSDKKLVEELAGEDNPIGVYRALTTLEKHAKVNSGKKPTTRVGVDTTRVARTPETSGRPKSLNDARRKIREQFLKLAK